MREVARLLRHPIFASALVALACFAVTIGGTFVYDDVTVIDRDPRLDAPIDWRGLWAGPYNHGVDNLYRPLVSTTYAIQRALHGHAPMPFHVVNWLLHGLVTALVAWVAYRLATRAAHPNAVGVAWIAGILFAVHPIHVEAVANVVGRAELMCAAGALGAIGLCLAPMTIARVVGAVACFVAAMLSKEQGIIAPLLVGACLVSAKPRAAVAKRQKDLTAILFALFAVGIAGMVVLREDVIHLKLWWDRSFLDPWIQPLVDAGPRDRALGAVAIAGRYLQLLVAPLVLRIDYGGPIVPGVTSLGDPFLWLGVVAILAWIGLAAFAVARRDRLLLAALLSFAIVYGMVGNILTLIGVNVAERLMYLPSAFFVIAIASLAARLPRRAWATALAIVATCFAVRSFTYAARWNDRVAFYDYSFRVEPRSIKAALLAMQAHLDRHELDAAERLGRAAIALDPKYDDPYCRLGMVYLERGDFAEAERLFTVARELSPGGRSATFFNELENRRAATRPTLSR